MHLAQLNIGHAVDRIDSPAMADFAAQIDQINALAEASPGFVWRHEGDEGYQDGGALWGPEYLVNLSVWESMDALRAFTYASGHRELLAARRRWFRPMDAPLFVAWWVPTGHRPGLDEAKQRLDRLAAHGPGPQAFGLRDAYDADGRPLTPAAPGA